MGFDIGCGRDPAAFESDFINMNIPPRDEWKFSRFWCQTGVATFATVDTTFTIPTIILLSIHRTTFLLITITITYSPVLFGFL